MWWMLAGLMGLASQPGEDEHLLPERSFFSAPWILSDNRTYTDYYGNVLDVFAPTYDRGVFARAIVLPSFQPEYAVYISRTDDAYAIRYLEPEIKLWNFSVLKEMKEGRIRSTDGNGNSLQDEEIAKLEAELPDNVSDVPLKKCNVDIETTLGEKIYVLWGEMLFRTRYEDQRPINIEGSDDLSLGTDGITYHFSFQYPLTLAGYVWSPSPDSPTGKFAAIADQMRDLCLEPNDNKHEALSQSIDQLLSELDELEY